MTRDFSDKFCLHLTRRQDDVDDVADELVLHDPVRDGGGAEGGRGVDLDEPGLEAVVDDDVVAVTLVAVAVGHHDGRHRLQAVHDQPVDLVEQLLRRRLAPRRLQEELQVLEMGSSDKWL